MSGALRYWRWLWLVCCVPLLLLGAFGQLDWRGVISYVGLSGAFTLGWAIVERYWPRPPEPPGVEESASP